MTAVDRPVLDRPVLARVFVLGLGTARLLEGLAELASPSAFLALLRAADTGPGATTGVGMKAGRDLALGLLALGTIGDDRHMARIAAAGAMVDAVDAIAVMRDGRQGYGSPVHPLGAVLGVIAAGAGWAAARQLSD